MKILFASSKEMNCSELHKKENDINISEVLNNIEFVKSIKPEQSCAVFKTKDNIYEQHQNINILSKPAIKLFSGISFRQLNNLDDARLNNVMILSALYGYSFASDMISPFRYDYTMKNSKVNRKIMYHKINEILKNEDVVYNLSSKEFSTGIKHHNLIEFEFYLNEANKFKQHSVASKKLRGQLVNFLIENDDIDLTNFTFDEYFYDKELSNDNKFVYVKTC